MPVHSRRRGAAVIVLVAILSVVLLAMVGFAVDVGVMGVARSELQNAADSAAMAAAWELLDEDRLGGSANLGPEIAAARAKAVEYAAYNFVLNGSPVVDPNNTNAPDGDVVVGYLSNPGDLSQSLSFVNPDQFNTVRVTVRRDSVRNGSVGLFFARVMGFTDVDMQATATATFKDGVTGFKITPYSGNAGMMPFALHEDIWEDLLAEVYSVGDNYDYSPSFGVTGGPDGIDELNLYPGAGGTQLPPGNFGTVDIGSNNNSTADLSRQITDGVNASDLAYHGGQLVLGPPGNPLMLNGDTGLSAGMKDELASIISQPRTILLFDQVSGNGNNAMYRITGFAGVRILNVKLTGAMSKKEVIIQPAFVVDDAAMTGPGSGSSYFVYQPVRLTR